MIIESIELNNFMCYYGHNKFDFTEGMNVIIGDTGYGKSKLYDGFYWAMYDQCFDTHDKKWMPTSHFGHSIISDKALFETKDGRITTSVIVTFKNLDKDSVYIVERKLTATRSEDEIKVDPKSEEIIIKKDLSYLNGHEVTNPNEKESIKAKILPDNIKPYMWFQGEQVESIIDFGESDSLTSAINVLSNITRFDKIREWSESWNLGTQNQYMRKARSLSKDKKKSEELEIERERLEKEIKRLNVKRQEQEDNLGTAQVRANDLLNKLEDANKIKELNRDIENLQRSLDQTLADENAKRIDFHKKLLNRKWILKGTEDLIDKFIKKYKDYQDARLDKLAELKAKAKVDNEILKRIQTRLPINVPQPMYIEKMLEEEKCLVCDREAPKGEDAWNKIKELLDTSKEKSPTVSEDDVAPNNFSLEFDQLANNAYAMQQLIKRIDEDINSALQEIAKIESRKQGYSKDVEKKKLLIANLISESGLSADEASRITNEYQTQNDFAQQFSGNLERTKLQIEIKVKELKRIEAELNDLVSGDMPETLIEKKDVFEAFQNIASSTRDRVFRKLVGQLEDEANKHYKNMMQENLSAQGIIKLVESSKGNYMPRLVDESGNILRQLNTSNIILIKLATIMSIISARQGSRDTDLYTLITDAPMSVFGEDYTLGFCKTVSNVYRQSIIMSKEFYSNQELRRTLMNDTEIKLGKVYMITPSIPEKERTNRNSLETKIEKLN